MSAMARTSTSRALIELTKALPSGTVTTDTAALYAAALDSSRLVFAADALIRPKSADAIGHILRIANRHNIPVTARGAGSGTTGAVCPCRRGWIVDLSGMRRIRIDSAAGIAYAEAGAVTGRINQAAEQRGWFYPPDPSSARYSTIGGNIATNAGGLRGAKYGVTRDYVLGLEGFLPSGEKVRWGGDLRKHASGYNVRDLWIGSEGSLGIITRAVLRLIPKPEARWTLLAAFPGDDRAITAARELISTRINPSILEYLDSQTVECTRLHAGVDLFPGQQRKALLLVELDGHPQEVASGKKRLLAWAKKYALKHRVAADPSEAEKLWQVRRTCSQAMFSMGDSKLNEDVVVPLRAYLKLIRFVRELGRKTGLPTPTFGHAGDGNFHVHLMYNHTDPKQVKQAEAGVEQLMRKVVELGGAITGEHGIGLAKSSFLRLQHSPAEIRAMQALKKALDTKGILNPGKIFEPFASWRHPVDRDFIFPWQH